MPKDAERLAGKEALRHTVEMVDGRLRRPTDREAAMDVGLSSNRTHGTVLANSARPQRLSARQVRL